MVGKWPVDRPRGGRARETQDGIAALPSPPSPSPSPPSPRPSSSWTPRRSTRYRCKYRASIPKERQRDKLPRCSDKLDENYQQGDKDTRHRIAANMITSTLRCCLHKSVNGARNIFRNYSSDRARIFNGFKRERLQYREESIGYRESGNSCGKSARDASELRGIIPEERQVLGSDKTEDSFGHCLQ
ncbi:PREDICTED: uncharacterized protein LOC105454307 [Wasmannia auropunctata]|uniref:uncharacterized protein LOC105454307 n=1 Tax=Wasmannia auropunctata TaxID=64793 RepID=UPI0005EFE8FC|nr:PREDICTED: uncharacterized protein LOC105454307 [Wasmannia auropunctata]